MQDICSTFEQLVNQYAVGEEPMSFHNAHGFLTALAICPVTMGRPAMVEILLDGEAELSTDAIRQFDHCLSTLENIIDRSFNEEEGFQLSCESDLETPEDTALEEWCTGFMEGHLLDEDRWFQEHEQEVCELLLPLMLASGLFDDEPEFREILKDPKLAEDMCSQIPEVLMELYLMFNSPEEIRNKKEKRTIN
ncbi:YecA family protein [Endozoicomonas sp. Mp262]|uniref:YecA/YgfB family protein n=1 Tax=Endozoicomonas sp. Mp262 TaxID=2919499 RepID=UPI0021D92763